MDVKCSVILYVSKELEGFNLQSRYCLYGSGRQALLAQLKGAIVPEFGRDFFETHVCPDQTTLGTGYEVTYQHHDKYSM